MTADWPFIELGELVNEITVGFVGSMTLEIRNSKYGIKQFSICNHTNYIIQQPK
jgi:hypothetical protein